MRASRYVTEEEEDDGDEEDVPSLVCRDRRSKASNDIPDLALSSLVSLQGMTMFAIDSAEEGYSRGPFPRAFESWGHRRSCRVPGWHGLC